MVFEERKYVYIFVAYSVVVQREGRRIDLFLQFYT